MNGDNNIRTAQILCLFGALISAIPACTLLEPLPPARAMPTPALAAVEYHHILQFPTDRSDISQSEAAALEWFIASIPADQLQTVRLTYPTHYLSHSIHGRLLLSRRTALVAAAIRAVLPHKAELAIVSNSDGAPIGMSARGRTGSIEDRIEIFASGSEVILPGCPNWSNDPGYDPGNLPLSNLGCANAHNLGMMISNPSDLSHPRPLAPSDGTHEAETITRYRTDKVKILQADSIQ